jgi:acyl-CoA thioesterase FadM
VRLRARRPGAPTVLRGRITVALAREPGAPAAASPPDALAPLVVDHVGAGAHDVPAEALDKGFVWSWRVPYTDCQFSEHLQFAGYVRAMEQVVDLFLADRGLSVATMLRNRGWIPVVSRARISVLADVAMEETVHTVFTVTDVLKGVGFDATMDCYVRRGAGLMHTATGGILHAYAIAGGPGAGGLATLDGPTVAALTRSSR